MRHTIRSRFIIALLAIAIPTLLLITHLYQKNGHDEEEFLNTLVRSSPIVDKSAGHDVIQVKNVQPTVDVNIDSATKKEATIVTDRIKPVVVPEISTNAKEKTGFDYYSSTEHLLLLLKKQSNDLKQVIVTIIGGDGYSLFAWDWYERMIEISNHSDRCNCFVVAMDEIAVVMAVKRNIPVFYSSYTFDEQIQWINSIEARQHSLYRVGHAKFRAAAKISELGYSVLLSEMDVFWRANPLNNLKKPLENFDLQISDHFGSHPRVNIGIFYVHSSNASIQFFSYVSEFWLRFGKGGFLADQRVLDALLKNYDRIDKTYLRAVPPVPSINWTTHAFGNSFSHMMTDGSAFFLFNQAAKLGFRSKKFYGDNRTKYFTVDVPNANMPINDRNLLMRSLLILQHTVFKTRTLIIPAFSPNLTRITIQSQLDIKKFLLYWSDENVRLPTFSILDKSSSISITSKPLVSGQSYNEIDGILSLSLDSIPLDLQAPSAQFEVFVRDSLLWCSPPADAGNGWCIHHPRDFAATMEILFACRGDPYPPCANKTVVNEQFLIRPYEKT